MNRKKANRLIIKFFRGQLNQAEAAWLEQWLENKDNLAYFNEFVAFNGFLNKQSHIDYQASLREIIERIKRERRRHIYFNTFKYAVVLVVILGIGYLYMKPMTDSLMELPSEEKVTEVIPSSDIHPGSSKAILTLGDKTQVYLQEGESFQNEHISNKDGELTYMAIEPSSSKGKIIYNELYVPRGGQFHITLSDGTQVWLNSDSKIRYPEKFTTGKTREVELLYGEAYFDVSPSEEHHGDRFCVRVDDLQTEVLGTEFNIKAYPGDKEIQTTLVEGSVALERGKGKITLRPRERATLGENSDKFRVETVASFNDLLWKEGVFSFKRKPLEEIMKVLERWYDMEVVFKDSSLQEVEFTGNLTKERSIEEIMNIMYLTNKVNYEIKDKTLILE